MPLVKVWLHFVWSTKDRHPFLRDEIRAKVFEHIRQNAKEKGIYIDFINGHLDHIHCLISLGVDQTLSWLMQSIKGESSFWINKNKLTKPKVSWQDEYFVVSVNEDTLQSVRRYIAKQEEHHKTVSFDDEYEDFLKRAGFQKFKDASG